MYEKSENFNSLRPILFELCIKNYKGGGQIDPPPAGIGLICPLKTSFTIDNILIRWSKVLLCVSKYLKSVNYRKLYHPIY